MEVFTDAGRRPAWERKRHRREQKNSSNTVIGILKDSAMKKRCCIVFFIMTALQLKRKSIIPYCKRLLISLKQIYINGQMNFLKSCEKNERWH